MLGKDGVFGSGALLGVGSEVNGRDGVPVGTAGAFGMPGVSGAVVADLKLLGIMRFRTKKIGLEDMDIHAFRHRQLGMRGRAGQAL